MREIQNPAPSGKGDVCAAVTNPRPWEAPGAFDKLPVTVTRYACPSIAAHMAWCAWCAEQPDEEAADAPKRP